MMVSNSYPFKIWRPIVETASVYLVIFCSMGLTIKFHFLYPIAVIVIANRILTLSLLCHEGLHGLLFEQRWLNNFWGRWLCAFPTLISFSRYRKLHLLHHRAIGHQVYDPDVHLYRDYPVSKKEYFFKTFRDLLTLKTCQIFLSYYTDLFDLVDFQKTAPSRLTKRWNSGDFFGFLVFYAFLFGGLFCFGVFEYYVLFFVIPLVLVTQPYVLLMGGLQHGPIRSGQGQGPGQLSRTIVDRGWLMTLLLPLDINFHAAHHINSSVPHYWLSDYSADLQRSGYQVWRTDYGEALRELFR